jgi:hypothetical protein
MVLTKIVNGVTQEMSAAEEAAFLHEQQDHPGQRARLRKALQRAFEARLRQGIEIDGHRVPLDEPSQARIQWTFTRARDSLDGGPRWPEEFAWRTADNAYLALPSPEAAIAFCRRTTSEARRLRLCLFDRKDALALTADEDLAGFDTDACWDAEQ